MKQINLTPAEYSLMEIIWDNEGIGSGALVKLALDKLDWKKSTTYTILKKLVEKKTAINKDSVITSKISRERYSHMQTKGAIKENFSGSLPKFLAAFIREEKLSDKDIAELEKIIADYKKESNKA
ncbi:MAG: BlaI/MecI/CopY family transcriptional regulator [Lachnospiraceae bacterium]|nr:BlaI/MecI/CopY family transcriptional regulator [Lachnospiraceae bacterium]